MKLVLLSDTHTFHDKVSVPDGDVLIHAGDITLSGRVDEVQSAMDWLGKLPHKTKLLVPGNHDFLAEKKPWMFSALAKENGITCLCDESFSTDDLENVKFYGSPWQPLFHNWAFNLPRGEALAEKWKAIPADTDVLITHGPPFGILDQSILGTSDHLGCEELFQAVRSREIVLHVFGHIHGGYGQKNEYGNQFINASICNEVYRPVNQPIVVEI